MSIANRIIKIRSEKSRRSFANELNINESTLRGYENGISLPNSELLERICNVKDISPIWLLTGTGSMLRNEQVNTTPFIPDDKLAPSILDDIIMIPMVKARLSAGGGSFETNGGVEKEYAFRRDFIEKRGNPKNMVLMRVFGDSMTPEIMDNDVVLIDQSKTDIQQGRMFAVCFEDCIYLKRIDQLPGQIILTSTNEKYAPVIIDINDDTENMFRVIGKILWCAREYL